MGPDWRPPSLRQPTSQGVPTLVPRTAQNPQGLLPTTDRRDIPPPYQAVVQNIQQTAGDRPMDLSSILGGIKDVARTYYDVRAMGQPVKQPGPTQREIMLQQMLRGGGLTRNVAASGVGQGLLNYGIAEAGGWVGDLWDWGVETWDEAFGDAPQQQFLPRANGNGGGQMACAELNPANVVYKWDAATQQYTPRKKYRRRRRRLATKSDIKDLASLKGIVGQGKVMETWIATHC
jgi:hypothetical protein